MIDSTTLTYAPFVDSRGKHNPDFTTGQSGKLLIGTDANGKKYLIKHCYPHNAANEFVDCWLAKKLDIPAPNAFLLSPNKAFQSRFAVAIEFLDLKPFDKKAVSHPDDLIAQFVLAALIAQEDRIQLKVVDNHIVSFDFSESFCISKLDLILGLIRQHTSFAQDCAVGILRQQLSAFQKSLTRVKFNHPAFAQAYNLDCEEMCKTATAISKRVLRITENEIRFMSEELEKLFPMEISVYYEECIFAMQEHIKSFQ